MITEVPDIGCQRTANAQDFHGWELVLQCLDSQQKTHAEDISLLKSVLIQLNENYDNLKREIRDEQLSLRHVLQEFREDFRSFSSQQVCPTCNHHRAKNDDTHLSPKPPLLAPDTSSVADSLLPVSSEVLTTTSAMATNNNQPRDYLFHSTPTSMVFNSDIFMVMSSPSI
jgi:hypothetical protein